MSNTTYEIAENVLQEADKGAATIVAFTVLNDQLTVHKSFGVETFELHSMYDWIEKEIIRREE